MGKEVRDKTTWGGGGKVGQRQGDTETEKHRDRKTWGKGDRET